MELGNKNFTAYTFTHEGHDNCDDDDKSCCQRKLNKGENEINDVIVFFLFSNSYYTHTYFCWHSSALIL